jgi:hypothetical protein
MPEISPNRAVEPATRIVTGAASDNLKRTAPSASFRALLEAPTRRPNWAHGPVAQSSQLEGAQKLGKPVLPAAHGRHRRDAEPERESGARPDGEALLDPLVRQIALPLALMASHATVSTPLSAALPLREDLQNLLSGLARRVAWGGDRRKGSARIELSQGALSGATLIVHTEERAVSVELELPPGVAGQGFEERIQERLEARGFSARVRIG